MAYVLEIRHFLPCPVHRGAGVIDVSSDGLTDLMCDLRRDLPQGCCPVLVRELHLRLMISPLTAAKVLLGLLARGQIEHKADALVFPFAERRAAEHNGYTSPVFADKLLLER